MPLWRSTKQHMSYSDRSIDRSTHTDTHTHRHTDTQTHTHTHTLYHSLADIEIVIPSSSLLDSDGMIVVDNSY